MRKRDGLFKALTPASPDPKSPPASINPVASKPDSPAIGRNNPDARRPNPGDAAPIPISGRPHVIGTWLWRRGLHLRRHGRGLACNHGCAGGRLRDGRGRRNRSGRRRAIDNRHRRRGGIDRFVDDAASDNQAGQRGQGRNKTRTHFHTQCFQLTQNSPTFKKVPSPSIDETAWSFVQHGWRGQGQPPPLAFVLHFQRVASSASEAPPAWKSSSRTAVGRRCHFVLRALPAGKSSLSPPRQMPIGRMKYAG